MQHTVSGQLCQPLKQFEYGNHGQIAFLLIIAAKTQIIQGTRFFFRPVTLSTVIGALSGVTFAETKIA
jgi:hypothetical protein